MACLLLLAARADGGRKFYDDDPLWNMPPPLPVEDAVYRKLSDYFDFFLNTFTTPGERQPEKNGDYIPAVAVNTLGEVPNSSWFTNRMGRHPMTREELRRGPGNQTPPSDNGPWTIVAAKTQGITPGFLIEDTTGNRYLIKFDPPSNPEMATGADVIGSAFFHALGYNVPQNYLVTFDDSRLVVGEKATVKDLRGQDRPMRRRDITEILITVPRLPDGRIRALASLFLEGTPLGEFRYHGVRDDDPNDIFPHEHRRDLRGLFVFAAWLGHDDSRSINTLDMLVEENGVPYVKHHLIDFGSILGSATEAPNSPRSGNAHLFDFKPSALQVITLGLYAPKWARVKYPEIPAVGRFGWEIFEPEKFKTEYPNPAFENRLPDDTYWAAKKVMAFSDDDIRTIVELGEYSDPRATSWLIESLIQRRDRIGETYFKKVLPVDDFRVQDGRLVFEDLAVRYGFSEPREYRIEWSRFNNQAEKHTPIEDAVGPQLPEAVREGAAEAYFSARIVADDPTKAAIAYLRKTGGELRIVGVDRTR